jgi:hypothetical protein
MPEYNSPSEDLKIWQIVLKAAREVGKEIFMANDIVKKIHETKPDVPATSIRTYVIAMAPKHPSYHHYSTHHPYFEFLGAGKYRLLKAIDSPSPQENTIGMPNTLKNSKDSFLKKHGALIAVWTKKNQNALISGRKNYRWKNKSLIESLEKRNHLSRLIVLSRILNNGGVDRDTLDSIMEWGFPNNPLFAERDPNKCLEITRKAFNLLDEGKPSEAICKLLSPHVGISRASKIIGLFDQNYFAIYDSRVGLALATLKDGDDRLIKIPPRRPQLGKTYPSDYCAPDEWGRNYQKLLWVLEIIRNLLNEEGYPFNLADVEMALFMMGK